MSQIKLSYFDLNGGRAEAARLAFYIAGQNFDDHRFPVSELKNMQAELPFGAVPVLHIDGQIFHNLLL